MKISQKLFLLILVGTMLPVAIITLVFYQHATAAMREQIKNQLNSIAERQAGHIQVANERNLEIIGVFDAKLQLKLLMDNYAKSPSAVTKEQLTSILGDFVDTNLSVRDICLYDPAGELIVTTMKTEIPNKSFTQKQLLAAAAEQPAASFFEVSSDKTPEQVIAGPLNLKGKKVGTAVLDVETNGFKAALQDYSELGSSGETYLVGKNQDGKLVFLMPLRFDAEAPLKRLPDTAAAAIGSVHGNTNELLSFKDYRSQQVMASVRSIPGTDWKLITKIDKNEVFGPIDSIRTFAIALLVAIIITALVMAYWFSQIIIRPIRYFKTVVEQIRDGDFTKRVIVNSQDEIGELALVFNKMTEGLQISGQKLHEEHARLKASIDSLDVGLLMTFNDGQTVSYNSVLPQILGLNQTANELAEHQPELTLATLENKLLPSKFSLLGAIENCQHTGKDFEVSAITYGNRILSVFGAPIRTQDDTVIGTVVLFEDITQAKVMERSKDEFFSIASHELRTPLTSIRGNSSMMMDYYADALKDPTLKEMVTDIHESSTRLIDIVNDFLDVSRIEQGKIRFDFAEVELDKVIEQVAYEMKIPLAEKKVSLNVEPKILGDLPRAVGDANRIKQVIYNLVGNAVKFTEAGGTITVMSAKSGDMLKVTVTDTGRGIPLDTQKFLFHKFQQAGSSIITRDTARGTGLGLYISKLLVDGMGGELLLEESQPDKGSTFAFTLPIATAELIKQLQVTVTSKDLADTATSLTQTQSGSPRS